MFHRKTAVLIAAVCLGVAAAPALAGNKGGSTGGSTTTSSIAIASIDGTSLAAATAKPTPKLGDTLTFATTIAPIAGWEYPMVDLQCYQDVNGDGTVDTNLLGPDIVFTWLDKPTAGYTLGGYSSIWTQRGGGAAVCIAKLDAFGWKGGKESVRVLATTGNFDVSG
jgi:hypothetical protein